MQAIIGILNNTQLKFLFDRIKTRDEIKSKLCSQKKYSLVADY
jgi:hypothetical protein